MAGNDHLISSEYSPKISPVLTSTFPQKILDISLILKVTCGFKQIGFTFWELE